MDGIFSSPVSMGNNHRIYCGDRQQPPAPHSLCLSRLATTSSSHTVSQRVNEANHRPTTTYLLPSLHNLPPTTTRRRRLHKQPQHTAINPHRIALKLVQLYGDHNKQATDMQRRERENIADSINYH